MFSSITMRCPKCKATNRAREDTAGTTISCRDCGQKMGVLATLFSPNLADPVNAACAEVLDRMKGRIHEDDRHEIFCRIRPVIQALMEGCEAKGRAAAVQNTS